MTALDVGKKLVDLCKQGKNLEAIDQLYAKDIISIEAVEMPGMPATMKGKDTVKGKTEWWLSNNQFHSSKVLGPFPHGDRFAVVFQVEVTPKATGKKTSIEEVGLYTVNNGSITKEEFFYVPQKK